MGIAGGCGVGTLWRSAEGYVRMWFALLSGILVAAAWPLIYGAPVGKGWLYGPMVCVNVNLARMLAVFLLSFALGSYHHSGAYCANFW